MKQLWVNSKFKSSIKGNRDKQHKRTEFSLNIPRIKNKLDNLKYYAIFGKSRPVQTEDELGSELLQDIVIERVTANLDYQIAYGLGKKIPNIMLDYAKAVLIARKAVIEAVRVVIPRLFSFTVTSDRKGFTIKSKQALVHLFEAARILSSDSPDSAFEITVDYSGLGGHSMKWNIELINPLIPYFQLYLDEVLHKKLSSQDESFLNSGRLDLLSKDVKGYFDKFWTNYFLPLFNYASLEQGNIQS